MGFQMYKWSLSVLMAVLIYTNAGKTTVVPIATPHPFYMAVAELNHNASDKSLEISCKFFLDDLEQTLEKANKTTLDFSAAKDKALLDKFLPQYINRHFSNSIEGKAVKMSYVGFEVEKESVFCYFEISDVPTLKLLQIDNTLLHDFTKEQINIIHVKVNGKRQSQRLNYPQARASFQF